jgi:pyruvate dehydrogenase E2 component (dihydrolipoamide acetyltransferase)
MPTDIIMPNLGAVLEESTLLNWLVKQGDRVMKGQVIFEAESDKSVVEVEAPQGGIIGKILASPGDIVPSGDTVAILLQPGEELSEIEDEHPARLIPTLSESLPKMQLPKDQISRDHERVIASPLARKIARINAINLHDIRGTGPSGRIIRADVLDAINDRSTIEITQSQTKDDSVSILTGIRGTIAHRMSESARTTAPVTLTTQADASGLVNLKSLICAEEPNLQEAISFDLLIAMIVAQSLVTHPNLNASLTSEGIIHHKEIHIGVAVDTERGLVAPVLRNVNERKLVDLAKDLFEKIHQAKSGTIKKEEITGSTFTITNLGVYGVDAFTPIINLPECAVLGIGRIREVSVSRGGVLESSYSISLSLTFDHRIVDGGPAARFLQTIAQLIEKPLSLWTH